MEKSTLLDKIDFIDHGFLNREDSAKLSDPILMNQVHSADALFLTHKPDSVPFVDALITRMSNLTLTVKTADCAPVLIVDVKSRLVAAVHAGWKGAFQGILENTVLQMVKNGASVETMKAAVGPHLQKKSFEIDDSVHALFPKTEERFFAQIGAVRFLFDFNAYIAHRLNRAGIKEVESVYIDTFTDLTYNSYRREPQNPARQFSYIRIKA